MDCLYKEEFGKTTEFTGLLLCGSFLCCCSVVSEYTQIDYQLQPISDRNEYGGGGNDFTSKEKELSMATTAMSARKDASSLQSIDHVTHRHYGKEKDIDFSSFDPELALIETMINEFSLMKQGSQKQETVSDTGNITSALTTTTTTTQTVSSTTTIDIMKLTSSSSPSLSPRQELQLESARRIWRSIKENSKHGSNDSKGDASSTETISNTITFTTNMTTPTRSEIRICLIQYMNLIYSVKELELKKVIIKEYEDCKHAFDFDDEEDIIQSTHYLNGARNQHAMTIYTNYDRVYYYQKAIISTNDRDKKTLVKQEYIQFCVYLTTMSRNSLNLNKI
jgi:hypothetical protein